jgi:hypothetical protein
VLGMRRTYRSIYETMRETVLKMNMQSNGCDRYPSPSLVTHSGPQQEITEPCCN